MEHKDLFTVEKMCKCLKVSKNAYYHWLNNKDMVPRAGKTTMLKQRIRSIFYQNKEIYGSYRIQKQLQREGSGYSRSYISVLMKQMGLRSVLKRKWVTTTDSDHGLPIAENVLDRDFSCNELGKKWVSDITYLRVGNDWNYLTTMIDLADRKVVGWSLSEDMTTDNTVLKAWIEARKARNITEDFIFHSDRGSQYSSGRMRNIFGPNINITTSMSRKGNCWDNAVAESFFKTIKHEWLYRFKFKSYLCAYNSIEEYIIWYNTQRLHSSLGYRSPLEMELILMEPNKKVA